MKALYMVYYDFHVKGSFYLMIFKHKGIIKFAIINIIQKYAKGSHSVISQPSRLSIYTFVNKKTTVKYFYFAGLNDLKRISLLVFPRPIIGYRDN